MAAALEQVRLEARALLERYLDPARVAERPAMIARLRPRPEDYVRVFTADVVEHARAVYQAIWRAVPLWRLRPDQTSLRVVVATVAELRARTGQADHFPGGYKDAVPFLVDGCVFVCWEFHAPRARGGMAFDGLVPLDGRWAWFPKPWKALPQAKASDVSHWTE